MTSLQPRKKVVGWALPCPTVGTGSWDLQAAARPASCTQLARTLQGAPSIRDAQGFPYQLDIHMKRSRGHYAQTLSNTSAF